MGRYPTLRSVSDVERRIGQGRGQGSGSAYLPWFFVHEVPSRGRSHKIPGVKIDRTHHLLSDLEALCFLALEFQHNVTDIREQFPLLPYGLTVATAVALNICHPLYRGTKTPQVMTSDFCVDIRCSDAPGETRQVAIAVKYVCDLKKTRVRELLAIECETNTMLGRQWALFTEETLPPVIRRNLVWLRYGAQLPDRLAELTLVSSFCERFLELYEKRDLLRDILTRCATALSITLDDAARFFKYAAWHHLIAVRMTDQIGYLRPLTLSRSHDYVFHFDSNVGPDSRSAA